MSSHEKLADKYLGAITEVEFDGNFTILELTYKDVRVIGVSKRNPSCDDFIQTRGVDIAYARALRKLDAKLHPRKSAKKTTKKK
jgi:hypothetical protein